MLQSFGPRRAVNFGLPPRWITFAELNRRAQSVAHAMHNYHRLTPGARVMFYAPSSLEWLLLYLACVARGQ